MRSEKSSTDGYITLLMDYAGSPFRDFESYLKIVVGRDENDIQLIIKQYQSNFVTYELSHDTYTIKDVSEAVYTMGEYEGTLQIKYVDIAMKTKIILNRFGSTFGTLGFDEFFYFIGFYTILWL